MKIKEFKELIRSNLRNKYTSLFLNRYKIKGLEYGTKDYLMRKIMTTAKVGAFLLDTNKDAIKTVGFGTFVGTGGYDWRGVPIKVNIVNEWNSPLIPKKALTVDEDVVLFHLDFIPMAYINEYVERMVDIESTIRVNLKVNKMPFVIRATDSKTLKTINDILKGEEMVVLNDNTIQVMNANAPYIIDKLQLYKQDVEAELLTLLNIDNVKFEKKAQMNVDEINANNDEINAYANMVEGRLKLFFEKINELFDLNIELEETKEIKSTWEDINDGNDE